MDNYDTLKNGQLSIEVLILYEWRYNYKVSISKKWIYLDTSRISTNQEKYIWKVFCPPFFLNTTV